MKTYAQLSSELLNEAADFLQRIAASGSPYAEDMANNAETFRKMAQLMQEDPQGAIEDLTHAEMAARLLTDASAFFTSVGQTNPPIQEAMDQNAAIFKQLAAFLREDPMGTVPEGES